MVSKEELASIDIDGMIYLCYDLLVPISKDRIIATHGENISLIDIKGEMICTYDMIIVPKYPEYELLNEYGEVPYLDVEDYLIVHKDGKVGLIDYAGELVIDIEYSNIQFIGEGKVEVLPL